MKVGILTFHYADNYGAVLQAFALQKCIEALKHEAILLDYRSNVILKKSKFISFRKFLNFKHPKQIWLDLKYILFNYHRHKSKTKKCLLFIKKYLNVSPLLKDCEVKEYDVDLFIVGSDQMWNKLFFNGYDNIYFLNFSTSKRKAFYAVSNGKNCVDEEDIPFFIKTLSSVNNIGIRENGLASFLKKMIFNNNVVPTVDPTFLLTKKEYIDTFGLTEKGNGKYVFVYCIGNDSFVRNLGLLISKSLGVDLIECYSANLKGYHNSDKHSAFSTEEFLDLLLNAAFVVTNSFHGVAFSVIFNKQFYAAYNEDSRKDCLLAELQLLSRHINNYKDIDLDAKIDYKNVDINSYILNSVDFLKGVLNE